MGQEIRKTLPLPEHLAEEPFAFNEDQLMQEALKNRPERRQISSLLKAREADFTLARRLVWTPELKTQVTYQKGERGDGRDSWGAGLGLVLPLWNQYQGERQSAMAKLESLKIESMDIDQQIALDVHKAYIEAKLDADQLQLWRKTIDQATEAARIAEQRYLEGDVDLLVFFQARRELVNSTEEYLNNLREYQFAKAELERAAALDLSRIEEIK